MRGPVTDPDRVASVPLASVPVDHVSLPPAHRLAAADVVDARDLDGEPVLVVDRSDAPTAHDEIEAYCAAVGSRPRWVTHAATQVERVLDLVAVGEGIGWLNAWQAEREAARTDVAVRRPAAGRPVRRVPGGLAGRRLGHADRRVRARRARDLRGVSGLGRADVGVHALVRRAVGVAELDGRHPFLGGPVSRPAAGARGTP